MMSQVDQRSDGHLKMDPFEIGWYIESADEEIYGPVSRKSLRRFLEDKTISPNTLIRHCTQAEAKPAADQPSITQTLSLEGTGTSIGDKLETAWPRKNRDRQALAEDTLPCWRHKRPAVLVCVRCHAPYCQKCRARPYKKQFYLCGRCQASSYNRRFVALILDYVVFIYLPLLAAGAMALAIGGQTTVALAINIAQLVGVCLLFLRDGIFRGAGPGKRVMGLRIVQTKDGHSPLTIGQGILRWLSTLIPFFNLVDLSVPFRDPLWRRYGDRWAGTRVLDSERKLAKVRTKVARRMIKKKGIQPPEVLPTTMEGLARLA
jgi:uncharacterized RDD family membrane protein YckC